MPFVQVVDAATREAYEALLDRADIGLSSLRLNALWTMAIVDLMAQGRPVLGPQFVAGVARAVAELDIGPPRPPLTGIGAAPLAEPGLLVDVEEPRLLPEQTANPRNLDWDTCRNKASARRRRCEFRSSDAWTATPRAPYTVAVCSAAASRIQLRNSTAKCSRCCSTSGPQVPGSVTDSRAVSSSTSSSNAVETEPTTVPSSSTMWDRRAFALPPAAERNPCAATTLSSHGRIRKEQTWFPRVSTMLTSRPGARWIE